MYTDARILKGVVMIKRICSFITEEGIEFYKNLPDDDIKNFVEKGLSDDFNKGFAESEARRRKLIGLPDGDIDMLLKQFREDGFTEYYREDGWNYDRTHILNNDGNIVDLKTWRASFRFRNKWNQEGRLNKYRIIIGDTNKILWIGEYKDKQYFISCDEKIYELAYEHKDIVLFPNISSENEYFDEEDNENNDGLIRKYRKNIGRYQFTEIENVKNIFEEKKIGVYISLDEHFEKGFFYKGLKWDRNWDTYYGYKYITILIDIIVKNGLFCIEIENITYPFYGYVLLDLNELKIVEAKKI
jgi:hypothetical protein